MDKIIGDEIRDLIAFCVRGSAVFLFLITIVVHSLGIVERPFVLLALIVSALAIYDVLVCEVRVEDRHICSALAYYGLMLFLALLSAWKA